MTHEYESTGTDNVTPEKKIVSLIRQHNKFKTRIREIAGTSGERIKDAKDNDHLHTGAFKHVANLVAMPELKRKEFLRSASYYMSCAEKAGLFAHDHTGDLAGADNDNEDGEDRSPLEHERVAAE